MRPIPIAILASGSGTTAEAFIRGSQAISAPLHEVRLVICNAPKAGIFGRISKLNEELGLRIETTCINSSTHPAPPGQIIPRGEQTIAEQQAILTMLHSRGIRLVVLLGYMKRVGSLLVNTYGWRPEYHSIYQARMLNTHPGLLPASQGLYGTYVQEEALASGSKEAGQTLHVVAAEYDDGPIVAEHRIAIKPSETASELFARVQLVEKAHITADIADFLHAQYRYEKEVS